MTTVGFIVLRPLVHFLLVGQQDDSSGRFQLAVGQNALLSRQDVPCNFGLRGGDIAALQDVDQFIMGIDMAIGPLLGECAGSLIEKATQTRTQA